MKLMLGTVAAVMLLGAAFAQPAEARCFWNGFAMECWHAPHHGYWHHPHPYWRSW